MCQVGDIILVYNYKRHDRELSKHSFVVISDEEGSIEGLDYDIVCNVMSSFKNEDQKQKKLRFPGNFPVNNDDKVVHNGNNKEGYIKAEQFYYFNKEKLEYDVIGTMNEDTFKLLIQFIKALEIELEHIVDNL